MSVLDKLLTENAVDTSILADSAHVVVDDYQWHLEMALPFDQTYDKYEDVLKHKGEFITGMLDNLRCVVKCDIVRLDLASSEYIEDTVLPSGVMLRCTYGEGSDNLPAITVGLEIVRGTSLRSLMRLLYLIAYIQSKINLDNSWRNYARIEYNGDDGRYIQKIDNHCLECWLERDFIEETGDVRKTTEYIMECLRYDKYSKNHKFSFDYPKYAFETANFRDLAIVRRNPGEYTLPMVITKSVPAVLEIRADDIPLTYFKYYTLACIISELSNQLRVRGTKLEMDPRYAQRMRLIGDWMFYKNGQRPEQIINYQKVYDTASEIIVKFPLEDPKTYTAKYLYSICRYLNENIKSVK